MIVSLIVAVDRNFGIGLNGDLLWHLPKDMAYFKGTTSGHCIITGRKNYLSIPKRFRPLSNRTNIILSRFDSLKEEGVILCNNIESALKTAQEIEKEEVFVIGGGEIYRQFLELGLIERMYITHVEASLQADTFFPKIDLTQWEVVQRNLISKDENNPYNMEMVIYERVS